MRKIRSLAIFVRTIWSDVFLLIENRFKSGKGYFRNLFCTAGAFMIFQQKIFWGFFYLMSCFCKYDKREFGWC